MSVKSFYCFQDDEPTEGLVIRCMDNERRWLLEQVQDQFGGVVDSVEYTRGNENIRVVLDCDGDLELVIYCVLLEVHLESWAVKHGKAAA